MSLPYIKNQLEGGVQLGGANVLPVMKPLKIQKGKQNKTSGGKDGKVDKDLQDSGKDWALVLGMSMKEHKGGMRRETQRGDREKVLAEKDSKDELNWNLSKCRKKRDYSELIEDIKVLVAFTKGNLTFTSLKQLEKGGV